jgi:hypothetical protein
MWWLMLTLALWVLTCGTLAFAAEGDETLRETIIFKRTDSDAPRKYFDQDYDPDWAFDALAELGQRPAARASRTQLAAEVSKLLDAMPAYGQKQTAAGGNTMTEWTASVFGDQAGKGASRVRGAIPDWFLDGYSRYRGGTLARSRYLDYVLDGTETADADLAALYSNWSAYDAEWFSASRKPGFKAWLSAVILSDAPRWTELRQEGGVRLHDRLVTPRQTKDEPWREIDNWINNLTQPTADAGPSSAFLKPKVREALVQELLAAAGQESDDRFYAERAYKLEPQVPYLAKNEREFFLLAALTLEYFQELYAANPGTQQPLHFRDYFVENFTQQVR